VCFICTQKPGIHCPSIRLRPFLLQIEAGIMSYSRMCLDWVTLCANWQGFKLTTTTKTLLGGFALENSMCWPTSPTTWSFHSIFLQWYLFVTRTPYHLNLLQGLHTTDSLTSLHQIKKELSHPNLHRHHIQGDVFQSIAKAIRQSPSPIHFFKVKSHAGIIGNEHAEAFAKKSATI